MAMEKTTPPPSDYPVISPEISQLVDSLNDAVRALQLTVISMQQPTTSFFNGERDAQRVDFFLWQMERYFDCLNINDDRSKVRTAAVYLTGAAALWWRRKHFQMERGEIDRIEKWEDFSKELKQHFCPVKSDGFDMYMLKRLKHGNCIKKYVDEFMTLMLRAPHASDDELLCCFVEGLQDWAKEKVEMMKVVSFYDAIAAAERIAKGC